MNRQSKLQAVQHQRSGNLHSEFAQFYLFIFQMTRTDEWRERAIYHQQQSATQYGIARRIMGILHT